VEDWIKVEIGRWERMNSMRSKLRSVISVILSYESVWIWSEFCGYYMEGGTKQNRIVGNWEKSHVIDEWSRLVWFGCLFYYWKGCVWIVCVGCWPFFMH
jgi:hypothetical protein